MYTLHCTIRTKTHLRRPCEFYEPNFNSRLLGREFQSFTALVVTLEVTWEINVDRSRGCGTRFPEDYFSFLYSSTSLGFAFLSEITEYPIVITISHDRFILTRLSFTFNTASSKVNENSVQNHFFLYSFGP